MTFKKNPKKSHFVNSELYRKKDKTNLQRELFVGESNNVVIQRCRPRMWRVVSSMFSEVFQTPNFFCAAR